MLILSIAISNSEWYNLIIDKTKGAAYEKAIAENS